MNLENMSNVTIFRLMTKILAFGECDDCYPNVCNFSYFLEL